MRVWKWGALALIALAMPAYADQLEDGKACAAISDSLQRLTCFDRVFPKAEQLPASTAVETAPSDAWDIQRDKSAIDDSPTVIASLAPKESSGTGMGANNLWLVARCTENTTSVIVITSMFMTDDPKVTIRIGDEPARTTTWPKSTNYKSAGLWSGATAIPFLKSLKNNQRLVIRVEDRDRQDATFNLGNVEAVVSEISAACKWKQ